MGSGVWGILPGWPGWKPGIWGIMPGSMPGSMPGPGVGGETAGMKGSKPPGWVPGGGAPALVVKRMANAGTDAMMPSAYEKV